MFNSASPSQHGAPAPSGQMPSASTGMEELAGNDGTDPALKSRHEPACARAGTSRHQSCARAGTGSFRKGRGEDMATAAAQDGPKNRVGAEDDGGSKNRVGPKGRGDGQEPAEPGGRDLTGRARIRNAGLHLFAANGFAGTPLRSIAA